MDISPTELLIVLTVAVLLLGPGTVPKLARSLGQAMHEFRRASGDGDAPGVSDASHDGDRPDRRPSLGATDG